MSRAIRFTTTERDALASVLKGLRGGLGDWTPATLKALGRLHEKMEEASRPLAPTAADFAAVRASHFVELAREILGDRVFVPPSPTSQWWARLQSALTSQGIDAEGARAALEHVATWARNPQDPQSLARNASRYLHEASNPRPQEPRGPGPALPGRPPELRGRG